MISKDNPRRQSIEKLAKGLTLWQQQRLYEELEAVYGMGASGGVISIAGNVTQRGEWEKYFAVKKAETEQAYNRR